MRAIKTQLLVLICLTFGNVFGAEETSNELAETVIAVVDEPSPVPSPLLPDNYNLPYVSLNTLSYMPSHGLFPVRIYSINDYLIKPLLHGYEYRLQAGKHLLEVVPDFSLLTKVEPFMNFPFESKRIEVNLSSRSSYLIGTRINSEKPEEWIVEILEIGSAVKR